MTVQNKAADAEVSDSPYQLLVTHGPATSDDLPRVPRPSKAPEIRRFSLVSGSGNQTSTGKQKTVYYLSEHSKKEVLRIWMDAHPTVTETKTRSGMVQSLRQHGREWQEAWCEISGEYDMDDGGPETARDKRGELDDKPCPFCEEEIYPTYWPEHIAKCKK